jgi:hypothetical protein
MSKLNRIFFGIVALVILSPVASFAQAFTNVTATVVDSASNPYRNCFYNIDYVNQSTIVRGATVGGTSPFQQSVSGRCDSFGSFSTRLASNSAIQPAPSQWKFSICDSTNVICFNTLITISGGSQDVSVVLSAASAPLVNAIGFPYINFATTALPPTPISGAVFWFDGTRFRCKTSAGLTTCGPNSNPQDRGYVNVMSDCAGVVGDGVTDDYAALQACLDANQDRVIMFPKLRAAGSILADYFSSQILVIHGHGTSVLGGGGRPRWFSAVTIKYPTSVIMFRIDFDCTNCSIDRLTFQSADLFTSTDLKTWPDWTLETQFRGTSSLDGIQVLGGEWTIGDVQVVGAKGNCLQVIGQGVGGQPDLGKLNGFMYDGCRAYGAYIWGADSNVAIYQSENAWFNLMGGVRESSFYGNTHIAPHTSGNARDPGVVAGANKVISGESVSANFKTVNAVAHGWVVDQWITTTGEVDGTFAGTCKITQVVNVDNIICPYNHADGSTTGGTGATSSSTQVIAYYTAHSLVFAPLSSTSTAGPTTWIPPYMEGNQSAPQWGGSLAINAQGANSVTTGNHVSASSNIMYVIGSNNIGFTTNTSAGLVEVLDPTRTINQFVIATADGMTQIAGKLRVGRAFSFGAHDGDFEHQNGTTHAIKGRNAAGNANVCEGYTDGSDLYHLCNPTSTISDGAFKAPTYLTATNCSSSASPAVCAAASAGSVTVAAAATTKVVNTTAVTANSQIILTRDDSLGTKLSVTCNTQGDLVLGHPRVTARTAGTSFTISVDVAPTTNPMCISYQIVN